MSVSSTIDVASAAAQPWDAIVIGAGPAGAVAACLAARRTGAAHPPRVLLVDRNAIPRDKVCGCCVNARTLNILRTLGLGHVVDRLPGVPLRMFRASCGGRAAMLPLPGGLAISRARFDEALVSAAMDSGAEFLASTSGRVVAGYSSDGLRHVRLDGMHRGPVVAMARVVLAADGLGHPSLLAEPQFRTYVAPQSRIGVGGTLHTPPDGCQPGVIEMAIGGAGYAGLAQIEGGACTVAAALDVGAIKAVGDPGQVVATIFREAGIGQIPDLTKIAWQGTRPLTQHTYPVAAPGIFLLGDAAGYVEPFTGEGIGWAVASAAAVGPLVRRAWRGWKPRLERDWTMIVQRAVWGRRLVCRTMAGLSRHPALVRGALRVLACAPGLARPIVERVTNSRPERHAERTP